MKTTELQKQIDAAAAGAVIRIAPGTYQGTLQITKAVTLMAQSSALIDAEHRGSAVRIDAPGAMVKLVGLTFLNGSAETGGGVALINGSLDMVQCTIKACKSPMYGGGAVYLAGEKATLSRCRFELNTGRQGGAVLCDHLVDVVIKDSLMTQNAAVLGGAIVAKEGVTLKISGCTIADNRAVGDDANGASLYVGGSTTRSPSVTVTHSIITERGAAPSALWVHPKSGSLKIETSVLPLSASAFAKGNTLAAPEFVGVGTEPYSLKKGSPGLKGGLPTAFSASDVDLLGNKRLQGDRAPDLGAFSSK